MILNAWKTRRKIAIDTLAQLTDEQLLRQISEGKSTGVNLLGHMIAMLDDLLPLLFNGPKLYPELLEIIRKNPVNADIHELTINSLREYWNDVNLVLANKFLMTKPHEWFERHYSISQVDFEKEPYLNKLSVVIDHTNNLAHHVGQLSLLTA